MKKSNFLLGSFYSENEFFRLQLAAINLLNDLDEQRNVKQPPLLQGLLNLVNKINNPLLNVS